MHIVTAVSGANVISSRNLTHWSRPVRTTLLISLIGLAVGIGSVIATASWAVGQLARDQAKDEAARNGTLAARVAFGPLLTPSLHDGDPNSFAALGDVAERFLTETGAVRVKVWSSTGQVLWSDDERTIGMFFALEPDETVALLSNTPVVGFSDLDKAENEFDRSTSDRLVEVYQGVANANGDRFLVETYYPYTIVAQRVTQIRSRLMPLVFIGIAVLATLFIGLAVALARRLARAQREREHLLRRMINASDVERKRIAAAVHDRAVQDLIGVSFSLSAEADRAPAPLSGTLRGLAGSTRTTVRSLRSLLNSIYPIEVPEEGWLAGLNDLVELLERQGVTVSVNAARVRLSAMDELLLLRIAREALRNASGHANPTHVTIRLEEIHDRVLLEIHDDGCGFSTEEADQNRRSGHLGLQLLRDLTTDSGDILYIDSAPGAGTTVRLELTGHS